jgi:hypothetical protein
MGRIVLAASLLVCSCVAIAAVALVKVTPADPVAMPMAAAAGAATNGSDIGDQRVVGVRSDRLALKPPEPQPIDPEPASAAPVDPALQAKFNNAQAMIPPSEPEHEVARPRRHHVTTRTPGRHRAKLQDKPEMVDTTRTDSGKKAAEVACANGNSLLRAMNLAPACN